MALGYLALVLHAHLPFVRHPEHEEFLEEDWYYEALTETYLPLLEMMERLQRDGVAFRLTLSLTPTLLEMFADSLLQDRYLQHLDRLIDLAEKETRRTRGDAAFAPLAWMYLDRFRACREQYIDRYGRDLAAAFRRFREAGKIDLLTSAATHAFLPLLSVQPGAVRAQIRLGVETHRRHLGEAPRGIWLPECGYYPSLDRILREEGLEYFVLDMHGITHADPRSPYGVYAPIFTPGGVAAFGRDQESSKQVWSAEEGYPGDFDYREFYRDIGFDLPFDYIRPYIHRDGIRIHTGIKYYRITGKSDWKEPYVRERALNKTAFHAGNFLFNREKQAEWLAGGMDRPPLIVAPYDAELFGHWWYEGPEWLEFLFRKLHFDQETVKPITLGGYLDRHPEAPVCQPPLCSWGHKGYCEVWLEASNDWLYRHLHEAGDRMIRLAREHPEAHGTARRLLNQAAREILLAQASDWAFIMKTGTAVEYAVKRTKDHLLRFLHLERQVLEGWVDEAWLKEVEHYDTCFPHVDYRIFR